MKPNLEKLYDRAPVNALAVVAAGAYLRADIGELQRLSNAVATRSIGFRAEFLIQKNALAQSILLWALDCWQTYASAMEMHAAIVAGELQPKEILAAELIYRATQTKLASLFASMRQICSETGIAYEDVERATGIEGVLVNGDAAPNLIHELVYQYRASA